MISSAIPYVGADDIDWLLPPADAVGAIEAALRQGLDPTEDPARIRTDVRHGQFLLMPSDIGASAGVKVATVAPRNPAAGLPRIHAVYLLFDAETLIPRAILDGTALTTLRTPAVSIAAIKGALYRSSAPLRVVIYGAGPQAVGHAKTVAAVLSDVRPVADLTYVVRRPAAYARLAGDGTHLVAAGSAESLQAVQHADLVVCATTASEPLFDSTLIRDDAVVVAVGSHEPEIREVDSALCRRAQVVVEDIDTALRECGDIVQAVGERAIRPDQLVPMREVVTGRTALPTDRPVFFKGSGMSWQDLVVADAIAARMTPGSSVASDPMARRYGSDRCTEPQTGRSAQDDAAGPGS